MAHKPRNSIHSVAPLVFLLLLFTAITASCARPTLGFSGILRDTSPADQNRSATPETAIAASTQTPLAGENLLPAITPSPTLPIALTPSTSPNSASPNAISTASPAQYLLTARFDYLSHYLSVEQRVVFTNTSDIAIPDLLFVVEPNRYPGAFRLNRLTWGDDRPVNPFSLEGNCLKIPLSQPLKPNGQIQLSLSYEIFLPPIPPPSDTTRPVPFGYTARQANIVDWYPFLPPYDNSQGWLIHNPWYYGEHQVYSVADYQVNLEISKDSPPLTITASAPAEENGAGLRYRLEKARSFALSASLEYKVSRATVGEVTVLSYAFPFHQDAGEAALQETAAALEVYIKLFGPYPHSSLSVVEADFLDGMEYDGLFFLSRGFYNLYDGSHQGYLTAIAVHETAHQWWYGIVGNDQALEPWLDEALCTYSERVFYERAYPDLLDWWWAFRVDFYQPSGQINGRIYDYNGFRPYVNGVYLRGARFLEELRQRIGDEAFFAFLRAYAARNAQGLATRQGFFALLAEYTSMDIQPLINEYFR